MEERILINNFEFRIIPRLGWLSKDDNSWSIQMTTPQFNWKIPTIQSTEKESLNAIKGMLELALDEINLKLKRMSPLNTYCGKEFVGTNETCGVDGCIHHYGDGTWVCDECEKSGKKIK